MSARINYLKGRAFMGLLRPLIVCVLVCLPFYVFANPASVSEQKVKEDTSQRFLATELYIHGNALISREELLKDVPDTYRVSKDQQGRGEAVEDVYDFQNLICMIREPGLECNISLKTIQGFTKYLLSAYQKKGYAGIYVYVPAATVEQGSQFLNKRLHVEILEGTVANLEIQRYNFDRQKQAKGSLKESLIKSWSPVNTGDVINKNKLDDYLNRLNQNPDRYVSAVISRSEEPNALNLSYDVHELNPWHTYIQADDSGTEDRKWAPRVGIVNTNLLGYDDKFSVMVQAPWKRGIEDEYSVSGSYNAPVMTDRLRLGLYGGRSEFDVPGLTGIDFLGNGSFYGCTSNYTLFQMDKWFFDVTGQISRENSKVTPSLGIQSDVAMDLWGSGFTIHRSNTMVQTSLAYNRIENMGGSSSSEYELARLGASPEFVIHNVSFSHSQYFDAQKVHRFRGSLRHMTPDRRLVPAKMTSFGGLYTIRGYKESEIVADGGYIMSGQYEYNLISTNGPEEDKRTDPAANKSNTQKLRKLAPVAFVDYGRARVQDPKPGEQEDQGLSSIGTGLLIEWGDNFTADFYYAWVRRATAQTDKGDGQFNVSLMCRF